MGLRDSLKGIAKSLGIKGYSKLKNDDLKAVIAEAQEDKAVEVLTEDDEVREPSSLDMVLQKTSEAQDYIYEARKELYGPDAQHKAMQLNRIAELLKASYRLIQKIND